MLFIKKQKLVRLKHDVVKLLNSSRKLENKKTDKNEKNTDRKSVSIFLSNIISISKKNSYSVKFLSFLKTKNFE